MAGMSNLILGAIVPGIPVTTPGVVNQTMSAAATKVAGVMQAAASDTITTFLFRYGLRTGTPPTYKCGIQGVNSSGQPDGTYKGGGSPASATFTPPADTTWNNLVQAVTLDNSYAMTRGEMLALVVEYSSGTVDASNNSSITRGYSQVGSSKFAGPYHLGSSGSWVKTSTSFPVFGLRSASKTYGWPLQAQSATAVTSNGNRAALRFVLPSGMASSVGVAGMRINLTSPAAGAQNWIAGIWDDAGSVVETITLDSDYVVTNNLPFSDYHVWFDTVATLTPGTTYYAGVERSGTNLSLTTYDFATNGDLGGLCDSTEFYLATWNGSAWSTTTTSRPLVELFLDDVTGGGGAAAPNALILC